MLHFLGHLWGTKAFQCTNWPPLYRNVFVLFSRAVSGWKIRGRLNGGLGQATHLRDTTSSGTTREASSTKGRRPAGESRHSWSQKSHTGRFHIPAST